MAGLAERLGTSGGHILYYFGSRGPAAAGRPALERGAPRRGTRGAARSAAVRARRASSICSSPSICPTACATRAGCCGWNCGPGLRGNDELRHAQEEIDRGWQADLETVLRSGAERGAWAAEDVATAASDLLALLEGLSTRVVLGLAGTGREEACRRPAARRPPGRAA
ncbi:TetR family transcriptional regulator C-terminal domain-containing protein [Yinghuangia aomiensis]